jgi:hypothetical protein
MVSIVAMAAENLRCNRYNHGYRKRIASNGDESALADIRNTASNLGNLA